jgi:hypothetical protein
MKKLIFTFYIIACIALIGKSQTYMFLGYNSTNSGRSIILNLSKTINGKNEFGGGIRFNINRFAHPDDQGNIFKKRLYATKPIHYIGINGFYQRHILNEWENISPFLFYDLQATYSTTFNRMYLPYSYDNSGDVLYKMYLENFGPFTWVEQTLGVGFKAKLFDSFYLQQRIGFGTSFILGYDKQLLGKYFNWFTWEFATIIDVGLTYRFGK